MENTEFVKSKSFTIVEILEYVNDSVVIKTILKKATGNVSAFSFDSGEVLAGRVSPFDTLIQVIEGQAEIIISENINLLNAGESIIIPANTKNMFRAKVRFKMLSTIIKSGYEDV